MIQLILPNVDAMLVIYMTMLKENVYVLLDIDNLKQMLHLLAFNAVMVKLLTHKIQQNAHMVLHEPLIYSWSVS